MTNRNLGKFRIRVHFVEQEPERVAELFALLKIVPVRCELLYAVPAFEYIAISERFPEVPIGMEIPEYDLQVTRSEAGDIKLVEVKPYG